jgi:Cupin-like domain
MCGRRCTSLALPLLFAVLFPVLFTRLFPRTAADLADQIKIEPIQSAIRGLRLGDNEISQSVLRFDGRGLPLHPLRILIALQKEKILRLLLELNEWSGNRLLDVDAVGPDGATALQHAASRCRGWMVDILVQHGAKEEDLELLVVEGKGRSDSGLGLDRSPLALARRSASSGVLDCRYTLAVLLAPKASESDLRMAVSESATTREMKMGTVDRVRGSDLSLAAFHRDYASQNRPVILEGMLEAMLGCPPGNETCTAGWSTKSLRERCGDMPVSPQRWEPGANHWADMKTMRRRTLRVFIDEFLRTAGNHTRASPRVFDEKLDELCPSILRGAGGFPEFALPAFVATDHMRRCGANAPVCNTPSLFVDAAESQSGMHIDNGHTHFWMLVVHGGKTFRIFPASMRRPLYSSASRFRFAPDVFGPPDYERFPLLRLVEGAEASLRPGDLLYIPAGTIHQVSNDFDTVALSGNFFDEFCLPFPEALRPAGSGMDDNTRRFFAEVLGPMQRDDNPGEHRGRLVETKGFERGGVTVVPFAKGYLEQTFK